VHGFDLDDWGLDILVLGTLGSLAAGVFGAWVLLVEILR
jgi:hypothetical protein